MHQRLNSSTGEDASGPACSPSGPINRLLGNLDEQVSSPALPLSTVAAHDRLFLNHKGVDLSHRPLKEASHILDISSALIERLQHAQAERRCKGCEGEWKDPADYEKYLANLEHLLLSLQQAAFEALLRHSLDLLQHDYQHWHRYLEQQQRRASAEYYSEWSSGRPPLNTTMPWNIKPSLVVLWGVCWMFYVPNDNSVSPDGGRPRRESDSAWQRQSMQWPQSYGEYSSTPHDTRMGCNVVSRHAQ